MLHFLKSINYEKWGISGIVICNCGKWLYFRVLLLQTSRFLFLQCFKNKFQSLFFLILPLKTCSYLFNTLPHPPLTTLRAPPCSLAQDVLGSPSIFRATKSELNPSFVEPSCQCIICLFLGIMVIEHLSCV